MVWTQNRGSSTSNTGIATGQNWAKPLWIIRIGGHPSAPGKPWLSRLVNSALSFIGFYRGFWTGSSKRINLSLRFQVEQCEYQRFRNIQGNEPAHFDFWLPISPGRPWQHQNLWRQVGGGGFGRPLHNRGEGLPKGWRWPKSDPFGRMNSGSGKFHGNPGKFSASIQSEMYFWFAGMLMVGTSNLLQFDLLSCRYLHCNMVAGAFRLVSTTHTHTLCYLFAKERSNIRTRMVCIARTRFQAWTCCKSGSYSFSVQNPVSLLF